MKKKLTQSKLAIHLDTTPANLSGILAGRRQISKKKALEYQRICKNLGYDFKAQDWIFEPTKIKQQLRN